MGKHKSSHRHGRARSEGRKRAPVEGSGPAGRPAKASPRTWQVLAAACVVGACVAAVHWPALGAKALQVDDNQYLKDNVLVKNPSWGAAWRFLSEVRKPTTVKGYYQPLSMISLMGDHALGAREADPTIFHATSLSLHVANTALLVVLMYLLFKNVWAAALAGLLFGLHPMTVEPIPWVSERKTLLAAFFSIICLVFYVRYATRGGRASLVASMVALVLALMSKPTSTLLPVGLIMLDVWPLKRISRKALLEKIPFFLIAGVSAWITVISQRNALSVRMPNEYPITRAPLVICHNLIFYLHKIIWPVNVTSHYPPPEPVSLAQPAVLAGVIGTVVLVAVVLVALRWTRAPLAGVGFFFVVIFPTMGVVGFTHSLTSDKFAYLPGVGLLMLVAGAIAWLWTVRAGSARRWVRIACCACVLAACSGEAVAVRRYIPAWKDTETLLRYMLARAPNSHWIRMDLAVELRRQERLTEAMDLLVQGMQIKPTAQMHLNLGIVLADMGRLDEAGNHYRQSLRLDPDMSGAHHGLGQLCFKRGDSESAIRHYNDAIRVNPTGYHAYHSLGTLHLHCGRHGKAIENYLKAVELQPYYHQSHHALAVAYTHNRQPAEAIHHYRRALGLCPNDLPSMNELARMLIRFPQMDSSGGVEPVRLAECCCELTGRTDPRMLDSLAAAQAGAGQFPQAVRTAEKAIEIAARSNNGDLAGQIQSRLALYRQGKPFRPDR